MLKIESFQVKEKLAKIGIIKFTKLHADKIEYTTVRGAIRIL